MGIFGVRLPATSANLGPGFDALGLAMGMALEVEAEAAEAWSIEASGQDAEVVGRVEGNLMVATYLDLAAGGTALRLRVRNGIPLGMGCGSSAAALAAGVVLANEFGGVDGKGLGMSRDAMLAEACRREGHPDNVAACFCGGLTASAMRDGRVTTATFGASAGEGLPWRLFLALPGEGLATTKARALLPETYTRADAVANVQATALLVAAFAQGRPELLAEGTRDRMHQPYRAEACPLLGKLMPLAGMGGVYCVTLSGAGPSVLLIASALVAAAEVVERAREASGDAGLEVLETRVGAGASWGNL